MSTTTETSTALASFSTIISESTTTAIQSEEAETEKNDTNDLIDFFIIDQVSCDLAEIDDTWQCSNAANHHSSCTIKCDNGSYYHKECICQRKLCAWISKNKKCSAHDSIQSVSSVNDRNSSEFLKSFIKYFQLVNNGEINVNLRLQKN